ncbi:MAG: arylesterase [Acidobacteria bacterium]|nr:arylesterase [Acidobacteriota bacterium]
MSVLAAAALAASLSITGCKDARHTSEDAAITQPASIPLPNSPNAQTTDARPIIDCFGDSLTAGFGTDPGQSYPDDLQKLLQASGYHYHVINSGISGNTTKDGLDRIQRVIARHPQIVVVEFGGNDGLRGLPIPQTQANLASIIRQLQASGARVVLAGITLPPDYGKDYIAHFDAMYPALANQFHIPYLPFILQGVYGVPGSMQADNTHATPQGNQQVALNIDHLIQPLLKH